jgi:hypothetical protein
MPTPRSSQKRGSARTAAAKPRPASSLPPIAQDLLFCLALAVLAVFVYRGYIIEGKVDVSPDTVSQGAPIDKFVDEFTATYHTTPLWWPHIFSGMPFQASGTYQSLQYTFETLIMAVIPYDLFNALHGRFFFHLLLGAVSMYFLGRALSLARGASFIAAAAFAFTTHVMATEHANRFICYMHIPLIFLATYRLFERPHPFYMVLLGGAFGSQLGAYHPQIAFYTAMLIGFYAVYTVALEVYARKPLGPVLKSGGLFVAAVAIAIAMAAVLVLPMQEYTQYSARNLSIGGSSVNVPFATSWSFPPVEILTFIIPSFAGFGGETYWGAMPFTDFPNYLGVVVVLLTVLALLFHRNRMTVFLAVAALFTLLIAFGKHLPPVSYLMLHFVPLFGKFRAPVMMLILLQFACALLAGYGAHALIQRVSEQKEPLTRRIKPLALGAGGLVALALVLTLSGSAFQAFMTGLYDQADIAHGARQAIVSDANIRTQIDALRFDLFMDDLWKTALFLGAATAVVWLFAARKIGPSLFLAGIGGLVILDLLVVAGRVIDPQYLPGRVASYYASREDAIVRTLKQDTELFRIFPVDEPSSNEYAYFGFSSIGGYHAAKLGIYQELMDLVGFNSFAVLNMLNAKYLISRRPLSGAMLVPLIQSEQGNLYRNATVLPRAFLVDSLKVVTDKNAIFQEMKNPLFNPARYAIVEQPISARLGPKDASTVQITTYTPHRIDLAVNAASPCLLVLSEVYYPAGWTATIDGQPAEIHKTNYVLRSVVVPAGAHQVVFAFAPRSFAAGHLLSRISSALVLLVLLGAGVWQIKKKAGRQGRTAARPQPIQHDPSHAVHDRHPDV